MKTAELSGAALDWAVAKCELLNGADYTLAVDKDIDGALRVNFGGMYPEWCTDWQEGGAIIEREKITIAYGEEENDWFACVGDSRRFEHDTPDGIAKCVGATPLVAAMRCYVASKLGDEVQLPEVVYEQQSDS
jgi:hypothetical protein